MNQTWISITRCNSFIPSGVFDQGINFSWRRLSSFHLPWTISRVFSPYYTTNPKVDQYLISKVIIIMSNDSDLGKGTFDWRNSMWELMDNTYSVAMADTTRMKNRAFIIKRVLLLPILEIIVLVLKCGIPQPRSFQSKQYKS